MNKLSSRRLFLRNSAIATTSFYLIPSNTLANAFVVNDNPYDGYNPFIEDKNDLRKSSIVGNHLTITGEIFDKMGTSTLSNINVSIWHLSPNSNKFGHQGKIKTDKNGEYHFITDFPNREKGKAPRVFFKVSNGDTNYYTELIVTNDNAFITSKHWEENNLLGNKLIPIKKTEVNKTTVIFNISI